MCEGKKALSDHKRTHDKEPQTCEECCEVCAGKKALSNHKRKHKRKHDKAKAKAKPRYEGRRVASRILGKFSRNIRTPAAICDPAILCTIVCMVSTTAHSCV
jgi:hypothetical protein